MKITKERQDDRLNVKVEGRMDANTAPELEQELQGELDGVKDLVFDFSNLEYISSAGLRVLLATHKAMKGQGGMRLTGVVEEVMEVFDVTGFSDILTIEK